MCATGRVLVQETPPNACFEVLSDKGHKAGIGNYFYCGCRIEGHFEATEASTFTYNVHVRYIPNSLTSFYSKTALVWRRNTAHNNTR